jgi:hypothetical protein
MRTSARLVTTAAATGALMTVMVTASFAQTYHDRYLSQHDGSVGEHTGAAVGIGLGALARGAAARTYYGAGAAYDYGGPGYIQPPEASGSYDSGQMNESRCAFSPHSIYYEPCFNSQ